MLKHLLQGRPLGHPLHPMIVHLPIALLALSLILDIGSWVRPDHALVAASLMAMGLAIVTALLAAAPGLADFLDIRVDHPSHTTAIIHMILNLVAVVLYTLNFGLRWIDADIGIRTSVATLPLALSVIGIGMISVSGYLGGLLVYDHGIGVGRHRRTVELPRRTIVKTSSTSEEWVAIAPADLQEGESLRASIDDQMIAVINDEGEYFAVQEFCTHRFGPLSEGTYQDGKIVCPWHGSQFDLRSGEVMKGPAKEDLKTWDVSIRDGQIALRVRPSRPSISPIPTWRSETPAHEQKI